VFAAAAHGLFIDGATELFTTNAIDGIVVLNTVPPFRVATVGPRLTVLDASEAIARAIAACHDGS
jgi:ribose-phosphate pyrophosphokinase